MANPKHLGILAKGVEAWNKWRPALYRIRGNLDDPDLSGADLFRAELNGIDLTCVDLRGADLRGAQLVGADFRGACLEGTRLGGANLMAARFAPLVILPKSRGCEFYPPLVGEARTQSGPSLSDSRFAYTTIDAIDLRKWSGLETVQHAGPSLITIQTLVRSKGEIPLAFLRGCGFPDVVIEYLPSLLNAPIQFYSCFISYSSRDQGFADRLHADLQQNGVRCWFAPKDVKAGKKLHEQIDEAIRFYDRLLLILSENSMNSEWVKTEIACARQREITERRQVLFPIALVPFARIREWKCFDADVGKDSAREIREYFIPDFSMWRDTRAYDKALQQLVRDLKHENNM